MTESELNLHGIIPPLLTPLLDRRTLDEDGLARLLEHVITGGVHGVFLLGSTGEGPSLDHALRRQLIASACRQVDHRIPVLVGVTDTSVTESLDLANFAAESGADAVVVGCPFYYSMSQNDLESYVRILAEPLPLPFLLYNIPGHTRNVLEVATVERLMDVPNLLGLKDSSANMLYFNELLQLPDRDRLALFMGPEQLLAESLLMGGNGGVSGGANLVPHLYVQMYEAASKPDLREVQRLQQQILRLCRTLEAVGQPPNGYLTGLKAAAGLMGLCQNTLAEPLFPMSEANRRKLTQHLRDFELIS